MANLTFILILVALTAHADCEEYIMAMAEDKGTVYISATVGEREGSVQIQYPIEGGEESVHLGPFSRRVITISDRFKAGTGVRNVSVIVNTSSDAVTVGGYFTYAAFTPLPIPALGTRYILPNCFTSTTSLLVIAAGSQETDIKITLRLHGKTFTLDGNIYIDGDFFTQHLNPYETYNFNFKVDFTGTIVETTTPVAVYLASSNKDHIINYDQLLPVRAHGKEFVVAVGSSTYKHALHIVSDYTDTEINFSDGKTVKNRFHWQPLEKNTRLHFNTTRPVMATLCMRELSYPTHSVFVVIPPVELYRNQDISFYIPYGNIMSSVRIMTENTSIVQVNQFAKSDIPTEWIGVPGSEYKVGTCQISNQLATSITSNDSFTILAFSRYYLQNGGYLFPKRKQKDVPDSSTSSSIFSGEGGRTTMIVAIICGVIIAVLLVIIAALIFYIRRKSNTSDDYEKPVPVVSTPVGVTRVTNPIVYDEGAAAADEPTYTELANTKEHEYARV